MKRSSIQEEEEEFERERKPSKTLYNYILNMHYLNKNNEILWSTCEIQLNDNL